MARPKKPRKPSKAKPDADPAADLLLLKESLEDWEPPTPAAKERLQAALQHLIDVPLSLVDMPEEKLMEVDAVAQNRRLYVGSLLRLWHFLARPPATLQEEEGQARLALGYIKHLEGSKHFKAELQLGRTAADSKLVDDIAQLRNEMAALVAKRHRQDPKVIDVETE